MEMESVAATEEDLPEGCIEIAGKVDVTAIDYCSDDFVRSEPGLC